VNSVNYLFISINLKIQNILSSYKSCTTIKTKLTMKKNISALFISSVACLLFTATALASNGTTDYKRMAPVTAVDTSGNTETVDALTLRNAMHEFSSLSKQERKSRIKEAKAYLKEYKAQKAVKANSDTNTLLLVILAILLPPLAVFLHEGDINGKFWLSLLLTLCFWIPGVIYALIVIL